MPDTLDDWLEEWHREDGWRASKAEVQRLVDELERLRRWQADADRLISHAEDSLDYEGISYSWHRDFVELAPNDPEQHRLHEVWTNAVLRGRHARGVTDA